MYYSDKCPYCGKIFYVFNDNKEAASHTLYTGIKQHQAEYDEDRKEYTMDEGEEKESNEIYSEMTESNEPPAGGYIIE